jgi:HK97 family phage portal protein
MRGPFSGLVDRAPIPHTGRRYGTHNTGAVGVQGDPVSAIAAYGANGTLFQIVNRTANAVAAVDWHLHRKVTDRKAVCGMDGCDATGVQLVERHAALTVLDKPNQFMTRQEFVESFQQHLDLTGEADWVIGRVRGLSSPMELWPVRPDRITPVPDPVKFLSGYVYRAPDGEKVPLDTDEVIQLRMPNPGDPYRGLGPVQAVMTHIDSARYSAQWNRNFFINSAEPGGIIEVPDLLGDDEFATLRDRWNEQHRGVSQAHRVAILEAGKWVDRKYTQRDMQFAELAQLDSEMIRQSFGYPKPMLGSVDDVNRANAEAAEVVFSRWMLLPRLERIKGALNADFLPLFGTTGQGLEFVYTNPVPADREADAAELTAKVNGAVALARAGYDPEDACNTVGLPIMRWTGVVQAKSATGGAL